MRKPLLQISVIMSKNIEKVRIIVVGDSGVGKTCLTHLIASNECLIRPGWTVGCNIEVKLHEYKEGTPQQQPYFIELFDIGGSLNHKNTRGVFYTPTHGIILVHDLTNRKSHENLLDWLYEILNKDAKDTYKSRPGTANSNMPGNNGFNTHNFFSQTSSSDFTDGVIFDFEDFLGSTQIPILVMGTKLDLIDEKGQPRIVKKTGCIADQCGAEEIWLNCHDTHSIAAGTTDAVKLSRFFDCVIEKRIHGNGCFSSSGDRRRYIASQTSTVNSHELSPKAHVTPQTLPTVMTVPMVELHDLK